MVQLLRTASMDETIKGARIVIPYDTYRLYRIERAKSAAEARYADEQAARLASAVSAMFRGLTRPTRAVRRSFPVATLSLPRPA